MLPWTHAAFGYLLYRTGVRARTGGPPGEWSAVALGVGTQLPDLVDKPFSWTFAVLPAGRSLSHSLFAVSVVVLASLGVARWSGRDSLGVAFAVGYCSHVLGDAVPSLVEGEFGDVGWLLWPVVPVGGEEYDKGFLEFFASLTLTSWVAFGLVLTAVGLVAWRADDYPGLWPFGSVDRDAPVVE